MVRCAWRLLDMVISDRFGAALPDGLPGGYSLFLSLGLSLSQEIAPTIPQDPMQHRHWLSFLCPGLLSCLVGCGETVDVAAHVHGPHIGLVTTFSGGGTRGHLELKLHDDKGDLELWLGHGPKLEKPFDLPLEATVEVEFLELDGRKLTMRPRDKTKNADENGQGNIRDGKTNYFIYPGQPGEDASWLKGKEFKSPVIVRFKHAGVAIESAKFRLEPHTH